MEFSVHLDDAAPPLATVHAACVDADPSALVDISPEGGAVRIATMLDQATLAAVLARSGWALGAGQLKQLPSVCCGGCSG